MKRAEQSGSRVKGWSRGRRWLVGVLLALVVLAALVLSREPWVAPTSPPAVADVNAARSMYQRVRAARGAGAAPLSASWQDLAAVVKLGGHAAGIERVSVQRGDSDGILAASLRLPLGFWLNGSLSARPDARGRLRLSARVGHLPLPAMLVHAGISVGRLVLRLRNAHIPPVDEVVAQFRVDEQGVGALVTLPLRSGIVGAVAGLRTGALDPQRVGIHYCRLAELQASNPDPDLAAQVRRAFGAADGTEADNRAAFVALSLLVANSDVRALGDGKAALLARCGRPAITYELQGRNDLPLHWVISAALATVFGSQVSISMGTWKEISDSGAGGSGFSLVDLSADRSGVYCAQQAGDPKSAAAVRAWLAGVQQQDLLPISALALAEGMSEAQFRNRYTSVESDTFAATVNRIDASLATMLRF
jgi:hypothetical protein